MAHESTVKAQVRLRFKNLSGQEIACTRGLQLSVTQKKVTQKTLEGNLTIVDPLTGEKRVLSNKCAEMDAQMPRQLGVSKAILENVIFCHQEESNWPLSEPSALKKKFDEIFDATKYTKALDTLKSMRKDHGQKIKIDTVRLEGYEKEKKVAEEYRKDLAAKRVKAEEKLRKVTNLDDELAELNREAKAVFSMAQGFQETLQKVNALKNEQTFLNTNISDLLANIEELDDDDDILANKVDDFARYIARQEQAKEDKIQARGKENQSLQLSQSRLQNALTERGKIQAEIDLQKDRIENRKKLIREISTKFHLEEFENMNEVDQDVIEAFERRLEEQVKIHSKTLEDIKMESRQSEQDLRDQLQILIAKEATAKQAKASLSSQIESHRVRITQLQRTIDNSKISVVDLEMSEHALGNAKEMLNESKIALESIQDDSELTKKSTIRRTLEDQIDQKSKELSTMHRQSETRGVLDYKKKNLLEFQQAFDSLMKSEQSRYEKHLSKFVIENLESDLNVLMSEKENDLKSTEENKNVVTKEVQRIETLIFKEKETLQAKRQELIHLDQEIKEVCGMEDYEDLLKMRRADYEQSRSALHGFDMMESYFKGLITKANSFHECPTCKRTLSSTEIPAFEATMKQEIRKLPNAKQKIQKDTVDLEADLNQVLELQGTVERANRLRDSDIPSANTTIKELNEKLQIVKARHEEVESTYILSRDALDEISRLKRSAIELTRLMRQIHDIKEDISSLEDVLHVTGFTKTIQEVEDELATLRTQHKTIEEEMETFRRKRDFLKEDVILRERNVGKAELKLKDDRARMQEIESIQKRIEEMQVEYAEFETKKKASDIEQKSIKPEINALEMKLAQLHSENEDKETAALQTVSRIKHNKSQFDSCNSSIKEVIDRGKDIDMGRIDANVRDIEISVERAKAIIDRYSSEIAALEMEANESVHVERNILDNLRLRKFKRDLELINNQLEGINVGENERAHEEYVQRTTHINQTSQIKNAEAAGLRGELLQMNDSIREIERKLQSQFKDIDMKVKEQKILVRTSEVGIGDLEKYSKALDKAIMSFHSVKMEEINEIVAYLWQKTYQGTDIDKIMIRSDHNEEKGARSYNYRVVMVKGDVELDMRGRCSAGQKVLSCIIIRLALGECFGINCGILALDEPTTNLDEENIRALADSLIDLIKERRKQSNFQLIIITHDEQLLELIAQQGLTEYYYRVSRNSRMKSIIERQKVRRV